MTTQPARSKPSQPNGPTQKAKCSADREHDPSLGDGDGGPAPGDRVKEVDMMQVDDYSMADMGEDSEELIASIDDELDDEDPLASMDEEKLRSFANYLMAVLDDMEATLKTEAEQITGLHDQAVKDLKSANSAVERKTKANRKFQNSLKSLQEGENGLQRAEDAAKKAVDALAKARRKVDTLRLRHDDARKDLEKAKQQQALAAKAERMWLDNRDAAIARLAAILPPPPEEPVEEEPEPQPRSEVAPRPESVEAPTRRMPVAYPRSLKTITERAQHLITRPGIRVLVDGYNFAHFAYREMEEPRDWALIRKRVKRIMSRFEASRQVKVIIVWDGIQDPSMALVSARSGRMTGAEVRFSKPGFKADDDIIYLCEDLPQSCPVLVVTADRDLGLNAAIYGANTGTPEWFIKVFNIQTDATKLPSLP